MRTFLRIKIYALMLALSLMAGCDKYLEENPDNRVELDNAGKAAQLLTNAYANASYCFTEWMGDNVAFTFGTTKLTEHNQAFNWEDFTGKDQDTPTNFWNATYDAIAHANEVLAVIDNLAGEQGLKDAVKAEALLTRAYGHFMLVNLFAKHYDKTTAKNDPGIPYVEEPETEFIKKYNRLTVEEVYDKIEDDLRDGLRLVNGIYYANSGKYHFTKNAALAFASRFYLYQADYNNCIRYSSEMLGADASIFVKDIPLLLREKINTEDYIRQYHSPSDNSNLLLVRQVSNFHLPYLGHWPSRDGYNTIFANPYGLTDEREDPAWVAGENGIAATKFEFLFERTSITSNVGYNYTIFLLFRGEEVLLNRAEANILLNRLDLAIADLQLLATKRYRPEGSKTPVLSRTLLANTYNSGSDQYNAFVYMLDERAKEFLHEGLRWFDIKRYELPVTHQLQDGKTITLKEDDKRKILQIPQAAIDIGGLKPNPR